MSVVEVLKDVQESREQMLALLRELVETESPSRDIEGISKCAEIVIKAFQGTGAVVSRMNGPLGPTVRVQLGPDDASCAEHQVLTICHMDTVYPRGTLNQFPFKLEGDEIRGIGAFDMKAGLVQSIFAMRFLATRGVRLNRPITLLCTPDEEVGSVSSRTQIEKEAMASCCVFIPEPSLGPEGALKTSRSGRAHYSIKVHGVASHSGLDPLAGASAIRELAIQIGRVYEIGRPQEGLHVNVGTIRGGTAVNVVANYAEAVVDVRLARMSQFPHVEKGFGALVPVDTRTRLEVNGGLERPPWEKDLDGGLLFGWAKEIGAEIGVNITGKHAGGGSDGNFTAALGVPTLDGLGPVGSGAHAACKERMLFSTMLTRTALLYCLMERAASSSMPTMEK